MTAKEQAEQLARKCVNELIRTAGGLHEWPETQKQLLDLAILRSAPFVELIEVARAAELHRQCYAVHLTAIPLVRALESLRKKIEL